MAKRDPVTDPKPGDKFHRDFVAIAFVITPFISVSESNVETPWVYVLHGDQGRVTEPMSMAAFGELVSDKKFDLQLSMHQEAPFDVVLKLPEREAEAILETGRWAGMSPDPVGLWLMSESPPLMEHGVECSLKKPLESDVPGLARVCVNPFPIEDASSRTASMALKKLGKKALPAVPQLLSAATGFVKFGCPQRFAHAIDALVKIAPEHSDLPSICGKQLGVSNYGIQKAAIEALMKINSPAARDVLRSIPTLRDPTVSGKPMDKLLGRVEQLLAS